MSANTQETMARHLAQALYDLLTHPRIGNDWEQRAAILLNLLPDRENYPAVENYLLIIYKHARSESLFGGLSRQEALARLHRTKRWKRTFPDPTPAQAFEKLFNKTARAFLAKYPVRTLADLAEQVTAKDLLAECGIGEVTIQVIRETLRKYGYELRDF